MLERTECFHYEQKAFGDGEAGDEDGEAGDEDVEVGDEYSEIRDKDGEVEDEKEATDVFELEKGYIYQAYCWLTVQIINLAIRNDKFSTLCSVGNANY